MIQIMLWNLLCNQVWKTTKWSFCPATIQEGAPGILWANQKTCGLQKDQGMFAMMAQGLMWMSDRMLMMFVVSRIKSRNFSKNSLEPGRPICSMGPPPTPRVKAGVSVYDYPSGLEKREKNTMRVNYGNRNHINLCSLLSNFKLSKEQ